MVILRIINIILRILIHPSFCVFNFMLPECTPNFAVADFTA